jgi:hypothetical protein
MSEKNCWEFKNFRWIRIKAVPHIQIRDWTAGRLQAQSATREGLKCLHWMRSWNSAENVISTKIMHTNFNCAKIDDRNLTHVKKSELNSLQYDE